MLMRRCEAITLRLDLWKPAGLDLLRARPLPSALLVEGGVSVDLSVVRENHAACTDDASH